MLFNFLISLQGIAEEVDGEEKGRTWLDVDVVGRAIFERLMMSGDDVKKSILLKDKSMKGASQHVTEMKVVVYLSESYFR